MTTDLDGDHDPTRYAERVRQGAQLRLQGLTWDQVATQVGYADRSGAYRAVMKYIREQRDETITELRDLTNARLERVMAALWPKALAGDLGAAAEYRRYLADYRRHNGLDAPMQVQITTGAEARLADAIAAARATIQGLVVASEELPADREPQQLPHAWEA